LIFDQLLPGQVSSVLTLHNVSAADEGYYFVKVSNAGGTVTSRKAALEVVPNSTPVAKNDTYAGSEGMALLVFPSGVLVNDTDENGQPLSALLVSSVNQGSLSLNADGGFTFMPPDGFAGSASFAYCAVDGVTTLLEQDTSGSNKQSIRSGEKGSQSFRHGKAGDPNYVIRRIVVGLSTEVPKPDGPLIVSVGIGANTGDLDGSNVMIEPSAITNTTGGASFQSYEIEFRTPIGPLTAGALYYLNFECNAANGQKFFLRYDGNNNYPNGSYYRNGSEDKNDITFQMYGSIVSEIATVTIDIAPRNRPVRLTAQPMTPDGFTVEVSGPAFSTYVISASRNFQDWTPISTNYAPSGNLLFKDTDTSRGPVRFYRAEVR
jgi:hypothetical protein